MLPIDTARLQRVIQHLREEPEHFDMLSWSSDLMGMPTVGKFRRAVKATHCGSTCCIAGWVVRDAFAEGKRPDPEAHIETAALRLLFGKANEGVTAEEGEALFHWDHWPDPWGSEYGAHLDRMEFVEGEEHVALVRGAAAVAISLLEEVIRSGGVWWVSDEVAE